jgi:tRNA-specific 2-thiouridylase
LPENPAEICLIGDSTALAYFEAHVPPSLRLPGNIRMTDGAVLGEHRGLHNYQVGHQVKLAAHVKEADQYQVIGFDVPGHAVIIGYEKDHLHSDARATRARWVRPVDGLHGMKMSARFYPAQAEAEPCRITLFENDTLRVQFDHAQKGLVLGRAIVFYDGDEILGGAYIEAVGAVVRRED